MLVSPSPSAEVRTDTSTCPYSLPTFVIQAAEPAAAPASFLAICKTQSHI